MNPEESGMSLGPAPPEEVYIEPGVHATFRIDGTPVFVYKEHGKLVVRSSRRLVIEPMGEGEIRLGLAGLGYRF